jgi:GNAT superfamily N-acetyltransferase
MDADITIRGARPDELDLVVAIDDDASTLYVEAGLDVDLGPEHPFIRAERVTWGQAVAGGRVFFAEAPGGDALGVAVLDLVDGAPYLEQLSVRRRGMRRGIGRRLLRLSIEWAGREALWLTTYAHLPWNRPFYERAGFVVVPEPDCPPGFRAILEDQRRSLPAPAERVAMRRPA